MKKILVVLVLFFNTYINAQSISQIDSLTIEMCKTLSESTPKKDSALIRFAYEKHLSPFFKKQAAITNDEQFAALYDRVYFRFQKNCPLFGEILSLYEENKSDWKLLPEVPSGNVSKSECRKLVKIGNFFYKEHNGDKVYVTISKKTWTEKFKDNTYSNLSFKWNDDCKFDLKFIESNNAIRKNLSVKDDAYHYGIFNIQNGIYDVWVLDKSNKSVYSFKLYPVD